jgi:hypothetical protein
LRLTKVITTSIQVIRGEKHSLSSVSSPLSISTRTLLAEDSSLHPHAICDKGKVVHRASIPLPNHNSKTAEPSSYENLHHHFRISRSEDIKAFLAGQIISITLRVPRQIHHIPPFSIIVFFRVQLAHSEDNGVIKPSIPRLVFRGRSSAISNTASLKSHKRLLHRESLPDLLLKSRSAPQKLSSLAEQYFESSNRLASQHTGTSCSVLRQPCVRHNSALTKTVYVFRGRGRNTSIR